MPKQIEVTDDEAHTAYVALREVHNETLARMDDEEVDSDEYNVLAQRVANLASLLSKFV